MNFDMLKAINSLASLYWDEHEILVRKTKLGVAIRLQVYAKGSWHHTEFTVSNREIDADNDILLFNLKWQAALKDIDKYVSNYRRPSV